MDTSAASIAGHAESNCTDVGISLHIDSRKRPSGSKLARLMLKAVRSMTGDSPPAQRRALYLELNPHILYDAVVAPSAQKDTIMRTRSSSGSTDGQFKCSASIFGCSSPTCTLKRTLCQLAIAAFCTPCVASLGRSGFWTNALHLGR
jgi:hypothetical protein